MRRNARRPTTQFRRGVPRRGVPRRGLALVFVLVVTALLSLAGYTFSALMFAEYQAADAHGRALQARLLCESGAEQLLYLLSLDPQTLADRGGLYDNPTEMHGIVVLDDGTSGDLGRYSVLAPHYEAESSAVLRYGLEDESAKLNLNTLISQDVDPTAQRELLLNLPGMTEATADAILDWLDEDEEPREYGAEADYYSGLSPSYAPKNGPLDTVEELLLVMGVTPQLLFGLDANRNGLVDANEAAAAAPEGVDNDDGSFDRGWSGYFTLYGAEANRSKDGVVRVNLNGSDLEKLYDDLSAGELSYLAQFVVTYRQSGSYTGSAKTSTAPLPPPDFTKPARYKFSSVLDLVGAKTSAVVSNQTVAVTSPVVNDPVTVGPAAGILVDLLTTTDDRVLRGRISLNQASRPVLMCIPSMTEELADQIIGTRQSEPTEEVPDSEYPTWILSQGLVTLDEMKKMLPYVTVRGGAYRAQIVGYFDLGGPTARCEAVFDATSGTPRQLFWREITQYGRGFGRDVLTVTVP